MQHVGRPVAVACHMSHVYCGHCKASFNLDGFVSSFVEVKRGAQVSIESSKYDIIPTEIFKRLCDGKMPAEVGMREVQVARVAGRTRSRICVT